MATVKFILAFAALIAAVSGAQFRDGRRQFIAEDITGNYKFFVKQGTCASQVELMKYTPVEPGVFSVAHDQIKQDSEGCTSKGNFVIVSKEAIIEQGNDQVFQVEPLKSVVQALETQGATFMVGVEQDDRVCGKTTTPAKSIAVFVEEEKNINIPGHITLRPGAKYMIVYDPSSPAPCTYFSQSSERVIGVPIEAKEPAVTAVPVAEETAEGASVEATEPMESSEAIVADKKPVAAGGSTTGVATGISSTSTLGEEDMENMESAGEEEDDLSPSESPEEGDGSACFPADATVEVEGGLVKRMDEIKIGDNVKVGSGEYSPVYMFSHKTSDRSYSFVKVTTCCGTTLSLTKGHYLYVNGQLAAAKSIRVGDSVMTETGVATIIDVATVNGLGLYNPQTITGDIMVNGIKASTYTTAVESKAAHCMLAPVRAVFNIFGLTTTVLENGADSLAKIVPSGGIIA